MRPRLVELAGPAGSGKTTLATELRCRRPELALGLEADRPALAVALTRALPMLVRSRAASSGPLLTSAQLRNLTRLLAWQHAAVSRPPGSTTLLDHGPAFRLAGLVEGGPPMVHTPTFRRWWLQTCVVWGELLDTVVLLDAPDEVLVERIRRRARHHRAEDLGAHEAVVFLDGWRLAYGSVLDVLSRTGVRVVRLDTGTASPDVHARSILDALDRRPAGRR